MKQLIVLLMICCCYFSMAQSQIIDMHLHSYTSDDYWGGHTNQAGIPSPPTAQKHLQATIEEMDNHNIQYGAVSGSIESLEMWTKADSRFIPGYADDEKLIPVDSFEALIQSGKVKIFGEIGAVYFGRTLNDSIYDPYLAICEEYDIPVAYHTGGGPPMISYAPCCPDFRIAYGDPFLIEDVLVKYPDLRIYLMHGGEVYYEHAIRMMVQYPHLYVDLGVLLWVDPAVQGYAVDLLKRAKQAELLDRVMFGSDQMVWPGAITASINFLNSLDFLTEAEKNKILYDNAARFLGLDE
jgi:predicted TIM-barrel fold metal-dependent hydrolase